VGQKLKEIIASPKGGADLVDALREHSEDHVKCICEYYYRKFQETHIVGINDLYDIAVDAFELGIETAGNLLVGISAWAKQTNGTNKTN